MRLQRRLKAIFLSTCVSFFGWMQADSSVAKMLAENVDRQRLCLGWIQNKEFGHQKNKPLSLRCNRITMVQPPSLDKD